MLVLLKIFNFIYYLASHSIYSLILYLICLLGVFYQALYLLSCHFYLYSWALADDPNYTHPK